MDKETKLCCYCSRPLPDAIGRDLPLKYRTDKLCEDCKPIKDIVKFISDYSNNQAREVWANEIHEHNMIKDNTDFGTDVSSYSLAKHTSSYRVVKRTTRVQSFIDKIIRARNLLYFELGPIFEVLDSIYINKDKFWNDGGNLIKYVHNACFGMAVLRLSELLNNKSCKYSIAKIKNSLLTDSKYVFKDQEIYERMEFVESGDILEERYEHFNIETFFNLVDETLKGYKVITDALKDYRDTQFAHIDELKSEESSNLLSYVNLKRMFSLTKAIYDGLLYTVAPDKYATIVFDPNIWFSHLNEISDAYEKMLRQQIHR